MDNWHRGMGAWRRARRALSLGSAALVLASGAAVAAGTSAGAASGPAWAAASGIKLPAGASTTANSRLLGVGCSGDGYCVAGGSFQKSATSGDYPMVVTYSSGAWSRAVALSLPKNAQAHPMAVVTAVACPAARRCLAFGYYRYRNSGTKRNVFIAQQSPSGWGRGRTLPLPTNNNPKTNAYSGRIACSSVGNCSVVGVYVDKDLDHETFTMNEKNGTWIQGHWVVTPSNSPPIGKNVQPYGISCPSDGNCVAVGKNLTTKPDFQPYRVTETNGSWAAAVHFGLPSGALSTKAQKSELHGVSCSAVGDCLAVGDYFDSAGQRRIFSAVETGGSWPSKGTQFFAAPGNAASPPVSYLNALACPGGGTDCVAVGNYTMTGGKVRPLSVAYSGGSWQPAAEVTPPATVGSGALLNDVACTSTAWTCVGVGSFTNTGGHQRAMVATSS